MNKELDEVIKLYSTGSSQAFSSRVSSLSKDELIALFDGLLAMYINDKNSSTLREFITVTVAGFSHSEGKIGFDGVKDGKFCEAKPRNLRTVDIELFKKKLRKTRPPLLDAGGSFNDYTPARFTKDKKENPFLLFSGFVDGKLLFVLEIPFVSSGIARTLESQLGKRFADGSGPGQYLRGARVLFKDYASDPSLRVVYVVSKKVLSEHQPYISRALYKYLSVYAEN